MKTLAMEVQDFFTNIVHKPKATILGGIVLSGLSVGDEVDIVTTKTTRKAKIVGIKRFKEELRHVNRGIAAGLLFEDIGDLDFRESPLPPNPYNPKTQLEQFLAFNSRDNEAENVKIYV